MLLGRRHLLLMAGALIYNNAERRCLPYIYASGFANAQHTDDWRWTRGSRRLGVSLCPSSVAIYLRHRFAWSTLLSMILGFILRKNAYHLSSRTRIGSLRRFVDLYSFVSDKIIVCGFEYCGYCGWSLKVDEDVFGENAEARDLLVASGYGGAAERGALVAGSGIAVLERNR
nr:hypothetical protein Iba_chr13aCG11100 [Ipomoea batatas]